MAFGVCCVFELLFVCRVSVCVCGSLRVSADLLIDGVSYTEVSTDLPVMIDGPELPPNGIELPFGVEFDEDQTISIMAGGWAFSLLLLLLMNLLRKRRKAGAVNATVEDSSLSDSDESSKPNKKSKEKEVEARKLESIECRMTPDN